jgi:6-phospho-3-hexuloisomerase
MEKLLGTIGKQCRVIDRKAIEQFIDAIEKAERIFITGAGRSGLVGRAFGMRLMHLGFPVYIVGETVTPSVKKGDLLVAISGSGETTSTAILTETARRKGLKLVAVTSMPDSTIGKAADVKVIIKGRIVDEKSRDYSARQLEGMHEPLTPLGTLFELSTMIFLDSVIDELMIRHGRGEDYLKTRHANLI